MIMLPVAKGHDLQSHTPHTRVATKLKHSQIQESIFTEHYEE
jgi:hypothetical protein